MSLRGAKMLNLKDKHEDLAKETEEALLKEFSTPKKIKVGKLGNKKKGKN